MRYITHFWVCKFLQKFLTIKSIIQNEIYFPRLWNLAKFVNHKYDIWNCGSWPEIKYLGIFGLKIAMCLIFMKFGSQSKSNMLIINISLGIDDLDPKLQILEIWSQNWNFLHFFMKFGTYNKIKHANHKYNTPQYLERSLL